MEVNLLTSSQTVRLLSFVIRFFLSNKICLKQRTLETAGWGLRDKLCTQYTALPAAGWA